MNGILNAYIMPHAPILIPEIGGETGKQASASFEGCTEVARKILDDGPDTIILSSPHAPCFRDHAVISGDELLYGDFRKFGNRSLKFSFANDKELADMVISEALREGISVGYSDTLPGKDRSGYEGLDHGAMVPLYFLDKEFSEAEKKFSVLHISTPFFPSDKLFRLGRLIAMAAERLDRKAVYLASGDLSHRLTPDAPAGYSVKGIEYDNRLTGYLRKADTAAVLSITEHDMYEAGECGTRSFIMALGALTEKDIRTEIYSYEGPFGVGYLCAGLLVSGDRQTACKPYADLARYTVEKYVKEGVMIRPEEFTAEKNLTCDAEFSKSAGVFVSIKKNGELRGCIGTISPTCDNVLEEIIQNAISASSSDPRFDPVRAAELSQLEFSVDVLGDPEPIQSEEELDVKKYGVIVSRGYRRGLLLPDLEGVDTEHEQVSIALRKAGISPAEQYEMQRFEVKRYREGNK